MVAKPDYIIKVAEGDAAVAEIARFMDRNSAPGLRALPEQEITDLVAAGVFYLAEHVASGQIVGTIYFSYQGEHKRRLEFEMGGGLVAKAHRETRLATCMAACGLVAFRLAVQRSETDWGTDVTIVGRVLKSNPTRVRKVLQRLGFRPAGLRYLDPRSKPGLLSMLTGNQRRVVVEQFEFDESQLVNRVRKVREYRDKGLLRKGGKTVRIDVPILLPQAGGDALKGLQSDLRRAARAARKKRAKRR